MIQDLNDQFTNEISTKQDKLDQIQAQVIETTRELASLRRQLAAENAKSAQLGLMSMNQTLATSQKPIHQMMLTCLRRRYLR
jgi:septal ring factor EnvC (AmiA/AmiB activator)